MLRFSRKISIKHLSRTLNQGLLQDLTASCVTVADESDVLIRKIFKNGDLGVIDKGGLKNFQTEGDRAVQRLILKTLKTKYPQVTIIGEEDGDDGEAGDEKVFDALAPEVMEKTFPKDLQDVAPERICIWVDPLDGTMEFIDRMLHHVTILIGIAVDGKAISGVVNQPFFGFDDESKKPDQVTQIQTNPKLSPQI